MCMGLVYSHCFNDIIVRKISKSLVDLYLSKLIVFI